ncbi:MAG: helicase C-terminal domain-containing protein [Chloroflexota bacterium]
MSQTYVAVDVETTGLDPYEDAVIEVAAVMLTADEIVDEWSSLVDPLREIPPFITRLTGITDDMVQGAPTLRSLRNKLRRQVGDNVIIGHNVSFDMRFLEHAYIGAGHHRMDTLTLATILLPRAGHYSLNELSRTLKLDRGARDKGHRALADARNAARLFQELMRRACALDPVQLSEIIGAGRGLNWPETLFFEEALRRVSKSAVVRGQPLKRLFQSPRPDGHTLNPRDEPQALDEEIITGLLQPDGTFGRAFPNYEYREQQVQMVSAVIDSFNQQQHLIVEAGTGTGKSISYLLPAAFWAQQNERCVVVSTNTINLQDQLVNKDLPQLQKLLPFDVRATVLKGKRNYLCTRLFQQMRHSGPSNADEMAVYARILLWLPESQTGDVNELSLRSQGEQMAWGRLSADNDACRMDTCREERCPLHVARRRAEQAHLLVVNHSLLLADVAAGNRVLPPYRDLIIDEAHHLESAVTDGLSFRADRRFLESLLEDVTRPRAGMVGDVQSRVRAELPPQVSSVVDGFAEELRSSGSQALTRLEEFFSTMDYFLQDHIGGSSQYAEQVRLVPAVRTQPAWDHVETSWQNVDIHLKAVTEGLHKLAEALEELTDSHEIEDGEDLYIAVESLGRKLEEARVNLKAIILEPQEGMIYWAELFKNRLSLHAAPLHIGPLVEQHIFADKDTVVLTSATLRTAGRGGYGDVDFAYLRDRLHAQHAEELAVGSPFDYRANTLLYLVSDMPEPNQPGYQRQVEDAILTVGRTLKGRTMALFTSYGQLRKTAQAIAQPLAEANVGLLVQGEGASRQQLLESFKDMDSRTVLLGTRSFWEGVDVPGIALQAVLIVRLPFDVPSDPIFAARSETFESPFFEYSIPEAVLRFRQGFGRLIRRRDDEGVVIILDKRVLTKRYGQSFLDALPECTTIRQRHSRLEELLIRWFNRERE